MADTYNSGDATENSLRAMDKSAFLSAVNPKRSAAWVLIAATIVLFLCIGKYAAQRPPAFDGAMNLQISYSLAHGEGHRRTYADRPPFPREVQTHAPYLIPAAAVFKLFGMGKLQAQLTNLLYLAGLALVSLLLLRKHYGLLAGAAAALIVLATPGMLSEGLNGFGEVPALFWAVAALLAFPWQDKGGATWHVFAAGFFLGLAVSTKTALLICFAWFGLCFVIAIATDATQTILRRLFLLAVLLFASLAPIVLIELWRYAALGDWQAYKTWWLDESQAISRQAGTTAGYHDTAGIWQKFTTHFQLLSNMYGLNLLAVAMWLVLPLLAGLALFRRKDNWRRHGVLFCLLGAVAIYFAWWLFVTPTQKAWHRRILDGSLMLNLAWVYLVALVTMRCRDEYERSLAAAACIALAWMTVQFYATDASRKLWKPMGGDGFDRAVQLLRSLPADAQLYGIGWHSAPGLSLFSERYLQDLNDTPATERDPRKPSYLVLDAPAIAAKKQRLVASMYHIEPLLPPDDNAQIFRVHFDEPNPETIERAHSATDSIADMANPDIAASGFYRINSNGSRWMTSESLLGLRYDGSPFLSVSLYALPFGSYMRAGGISLHATLDGCELDPIELPKPGINTLQFPVTPQCRPRNGESIVIRLTTDNLARSSITRDERALSFLVKKVGFSGKCDGQVACDRLLATPAHHVNTSPINTSPKLELEPKVLDLCDSDRQTHRIDVSWNIPGAGTKSWKVWVAAPGEPRKLWAAGQGSNGAQETGDWVVDGTTFTLTGEDDRELARSTIKARQCP